MLNDSLCCGVNAEARFERDALDQPGVRDIIVLEGINDFGFSALPPNPVIDPVTDVSAAWIRTSGAFDGVIDFDKLMRSAADPLALNPAYDSGDHLHPNDAGYQAMASAIDLNLLFARG